MCSGTPCGCQENFDGHSAGFASLEGKREGSVRTGVMNHALATADAAAQGGVMNHARTNGFPPQGRRPTQQDILTYVCHPCTIILHEIRPIEGVLRDLVPFVGTGIGPPTPSL